MTHKDITYKELIGEAYHLTKKHFWFLLGIFFITIVIQIAFSRIPIVAQIVSMAVSIATMYISLKIASGHRPTFDDLLFPIKHYHVLWHYFLAVILLFFMYAAGALFVATGVAVGLITGSWIFLIILGTAVFGALVYFATRFGFFGFFVVEHESLGPVDALKMSWEVTEGRFWRLIGYFIAFFFINLLGLILFLIGALFTIPLTIIATALIYKQWAHASTSTQGRHIASE